MRTSGLKKRVFSVKSAAAFARDGYVTSPAEVMSTVELLELRRLIEPLFAGWNDLPVGYGQDLGDGSSSFPRLPEIVHPSRLVPQLTKAPGFHRLRAAAAELLGHEHLRLHFDHALVKPPGGPATAWHQDLAFDPTNDGPMATVWLPFDNVDELNGTMRFIPGSNREPLCEHVVHGRHGRNALGVDESRTATVQLPAGAVCVHSPRTLHGATANTTDQARLAWVVKFVPDSRRALRRRLALRRFTSQPVALRSS